MATSLRHSAPRPRRHGVLLEPEDRRQLRASRMAHHARLPREPPARSRRAAARGRTDVDGGSRALRRRPGHRLGLRRHPRRSVVPPPPRRRRLPHLDQPAAYDSCGRREHGSPASEARRWKHLGAEILNGENVRAQITCRVDVAIGQARSGRAPFSRLRISAPRWHPAFASLGRTRAPYVLAVSSPPAAVDDLLGTAAAPDGRLPGSAWSGVVARRLGGRRPAEGDRAEHLHETAGCRAPGAAGARP